jgi:hypothetical protein
MDGRGNPTWLPRAATIEGREQGLPAPAENIKINLTEYRATDVSTDYRVWRKQTMSGVSDVTTAMSVAVDNAIGFCAEKARLNGKEQVLEARGRGDCTVCDYLRYGLAKEIAEYLGAQDSKARAIYFYEENEIVMFQGVHTSGKPRLSPGIRLIAWVSQKSPALESLVESLTLAVDEESRQLHCPRANALCHQLDVVVVDDDEVQRRVGSGALLTSPFLSPIEIWRR